MQRVYLDYAATTPVHPQVLEAMMPYFSDKFGNPSSFHVYGQQAEAAVESAREEVARALNCFPDEIIFTSCGSESDNLALRGAALYARKERKAAWILTTHAEHHAVSRTAEQLETEADFRVEWLAVSEYGVVTTESVEKAIGDRTAIVSIMYANNEIGTINPIDEIARVCRMKGVLFHTDAVQAAAYLPLDLRKLSLDLLSLGAHKFYGPKGIGVLFARRGTPLVAHLTGGGQERNLRAGTHNVPLIVGFAEALRLAVLERQERVAHVQPLRDRIIRCVLESIPLSRLTGHPHLRLPNHCSFVFKNADGNLLLTLLDAAGFACSSGSACKTGDPEPSEVLTALGFTRDWGLGSLRVTVGAGTTSEQVESFLSVLPAIVQKARRQTNG